MAKKHVFTRSTRTGSLLRRRGKGQRSLYINHLLYLYIISSISANTSRINYFPIIPPDLPCKSNSSRTTVVSLSKRSYSSHHGDHGFCSFVWHLQTLWNKTVPTQSILEHDTPLWILIPPPCEGENCFTKIRVRKYVGTSLMERYFFASWSRLPVTCAKITRY